MQAYYSIGLLVAFYICLIAEFFLPTGGLLGFAAAATLIATLVFAFSHGMTFGSVMLLVLCITTPAILMGLIRVWPYTAIGRRMLNRRPGQVDQQGPPRTTASGTRLDALVGRCGVAKSNLLPSGRIAIDGEKMDAISIGMPIDVGQPVIVTAVMANRVQVRLATAEDQADAPEPVPQSPPSLEQSLETLDFE